MIPQNPAFREAVQAVFTSQKVLDTLGVTLLHVAPGEADLALPFHEQFGQHDGFIHAGIITTVVDTACGLSALSLMPAGASVLTVEYKVNFLRPALGERFLCQGRVKKPGKTISVCEGEVVAITGEQQKIIATMLTTMINVMPS